MVKNVRQLGVWMNGQRVGTWEQSSGEHRFSYSTTWLESADARPLSLSMPLRSSSTPYRGQVVEAFFDNLLPDSKDLRERIQAKTGARSTKVMDLLGELGRDCLGAVRLLREGEEDQVPGKPESKTLA